MYYVGYVPSKTVCKVFLVLYMLVDFCGFLEFKFKIY